MLIFPAVGLGGVLGIALVCTMDICWYFRIILVCAAGICQYLDSYWLSLWIFVGLLLGWSIHWCHQVVWYHYDSIVMRPSGPCTCCSGSHTRICVGCAVFFIINEYERKVAKYIRCVTGHKGEGSV